MRSAWRWLCGQAAPGFPLSLKCDPLLRAAQTIAAGGSSRGDLRATADLQLEEE